MISLNKSVNNLFSPEEIDILSKKYYNEKLSKSDAQVYSRTIRKRLVAILNLELRKIAELIIYS